MSIKPLNQGIGCLVLMYLSIEPVLAGPGGKIARAVYETFWGKVILGILTVVFLPLILSVMLQERAATRRAQKDLAYVAVRNKEFGWLNIQNRAKECFLRVHGGWQDGDLSDVSQWMTSWYWQNQQSVFLDQWKEQGLTNVCKVKKIKGMRPLLFVHRYNQDTKHDDSQIIISIVARVQDYLENQSTSEVVEGSKKWKDVTTLWTFTMTDGQWLVSDIEETDNSLMYAKMRKDLPEIESTMLGQMDA